MAFISAILISVRINIAGISVKVNSKGHYKRGENANGIYTISHIERNKN